VFGGIRRARKAEKGGIRAPRLGDVLPTGGIRSGAADDALGGLRLKDDLSAKMRELDVRTTGTLERFVAPIQAFIEALARRAQERAQQRGGRHLLEIARLLEQAQAEMQAGNFSAALRLLDRVLRLDRVVYEAVFLKALCLAGMKRMPEAIRLANDGARQCPQQALREEFRKLAEALRFLQSLLPLLEACSAYEQRNYREAIQLFDQAMRELPGESLALNGKSVCLMHLEEWRPALNTLDQQRGEARNHPAHHFHRAICLMKLGDVAGARAAVQEARRHKPEADLRAQLDVLTEAIPREDILTAMRAERWSDALQLLSPMVRRDHRNAWAHFHITVCHAKLAEQYSSGTFPGRASVIEEVRRAREALDLAGAACGQDEPDLRAAIDSLSRQLPEAWRL